VSILIAAVLEPSIKSFSRYKIPRTVSVLVTYIFLLGLTGVAIASLVPALIAQTTSFINNLPTFISNVGLSKGVSDQVAKELLTDLGSLPAQVAKLTVSLFSNVLSVIAVLVFAFYILVERERLDDQLASLVGEKRKNEVLRFINVLENRLGGWARGQFTLMLVVGLATYIGLRLLKLPFSLPLAILAGLFEIVPIVGPILSAIPAILIGFGISPVLGFSTIALYFLVQQLENYAFVPKIMQRQAGISPVTTLLALAIGFRLAGLAGVIMAVPVYIAIQELVKEYLIKES